MKQVYKEKVNLPWGTLTIMGPSEVPLKNKKIRLEKRFQKYKDSLRIDTIDNEQFREVKESNGRYYISNIGRLAKRYIDRDTILPGYNFKGYIKYSISNERNKRTILGAHQLVAEAFLGHIRSGHEIVVDHINHDTLDNKVENLRLVTNIENSSNKKARKYNLPTGVQKTKSGKYVAVTGKKKLRLGIFNTPEEASLAYQKYHKN